MKCKEEVKEELKEVGSTIKYFVIDTFFDEQEEAEAYALERTNPVSSKVWISVVIYKDIDDFYCIKSYTL